MGTLSAIQQNTIDFMQQLVSGGGGSNPPSETEFFQEPPKFFMPLARKNLKLGKDLYDYQINHLGNALLVEDYDANVIIDSCSIQLKTAFKFPKDCLISGSFVMHHITKQLCGIDHKYDDIDIYFKTKEDAQEFLTLNGEPNHYAFDFKNPMCAYGFLGPNKLNLIYGVKYKDVGNLISRFDIRACSMAIDPNTNMLYAVEGALDDATRKILTFNPVPRGVSVRRFTKYIQKGFTPDKHQNVFFVELLRSDIYSQELELMTKDY